MRGPTTHKDMGGKALRRFYKKKENIYVEFGWEATKGGSKKASSPRGGDPIKQAALAALLEFGGKVGIGKKTEIPARPVLSWVTRNKKRDIIREEKKLLSKVPVKNRDTGTVVKHVGEPLGKFLKKQVQERIQKVSSPPNKAPKRGNNPWIITKSLLKSVSFSVKQGK